MKVVIILAIFYSNLCNAMSTIEEFLKEANRLTQEEQAIAKGRTLVQSLPLFEKLSQKYAENPLSYNIVNQRLSQEYSFAGLHDKSLEIRSRGKEPNKSTLDDLTSFTIKGAVAQISQAAEEHQIVMINEAHHVAQHRVLTYRLLTKLWGQGFRYFAAEAFNSEAEKVLSKGYITTNVGYYVNEPTFANLVLEARNIGFKIISYDNDNPNKSGTIDERESNSAQTIKEKVFDKDPSAKVIIHVGHSHIDEEEWLASKLKAITQLETLTIDQTKLTEQSHVQYEHPTYTMASQLENIAEPFVFVKKGNIWSSEPTKWDISVFWPKTTYQLGRPNWADLGRIKLTIPTSKCENKFPCMIEVFKFDEINETPTDRILILSKTDKKIVFLASDENILVITGNDGQRLSIQTVMGTSVKTL